MRVFVLGSGSGGNALLVESCGTRVLIEAGLGPKTVAARLAELGLDVAAGELHGIVASHQHGDHFGHADKLAAAFSAPLYLHPGIPGIEAAEGLDVRRYDIGRALRVGALTLTTVQVPHDAAQVAVRVDDGTHALGVATDVGRVTPGLVALLGECDAALVEANHCSEMLAFSEYPDVVKRRIAGGWGHLSNDQTAELAARLVGSRLARLWLGHLSRSNNTPARALETVASRARRIDVDVLPASSPVALHVRAIKPHQLGLPF
ncbi:MAG: MBL fold metallo-hydrolase [Labilithrix sp.]|nr:MBL fold metallo-hydrolase [Labilithrix sp.]MCW5837892.1 MBL fold metallo-hydrolase [Labilithrix sp.]